MHISEIEIAPVQSQNGLVAFASLVFENAFYMSSIGIFTRASGGYRLTYPIRKNSTKNLNVFFPINKEVANEIEEAVIKKFEEMKK
ncbi:MAG: septation protein SpoVG family protein [Candidatus Babeliales bacterium]|nr:septation protein SpoVG family protein [Candidatus Babeliales bacterium]